MVSLSHPNRISINLNMAGIIMYIKTTPGQEEIQATTGDLITTTTPTHVIRSFVLCPLVPMVISTKDKISIFLEMIIQLEDTHRGEMDVNIPLMGFKTERNGLPHLEKNRVALLFMITSSSVKTHPEW